jgi:methyl-accepting chemotaxis protein
MRTFFSRITGYTLAITAIAGLLFSAFGIIYIWRIKSHLSENFLATFEIIDSSLKVTSDGLELTKQTLDNASLNVSSLEDTVSTTGRTIEQSTSMVDSLSTLLSDKLPQTIYATQASLLAAQSSARFIEQALTAITSLPLIPGNTYKPTIPLYEALSRVSASLDPLPQSFEQMSKSLQSTRGNLIVIQTQFKIIARHVEDINNNLSEAKSVITDYQNVISELQQRIERLESKVPWWIDLITWSFSLGFVWLGFTQLGLLLFGLDKIKQHRMTLEN